MRDYIVHWIFLAYIVAICELKLNVDDDDDDNDKMVSISVNNVTPENRLS